MKHQSTFDQDHDFVRDIARINVCAVLGWVEQSFAPEDVFDDAELETWAINHGWEPKHDGVSNHDR
jgi:hypothetical protein